MSPQEKALVQETWRHVAPISDRAASLFYDRLFEIDPDVGELFAGVDMVCQRARLMQALAAVVGSLDDIEKMVPELEALGRRHVGYGVTDAHYDKVGAALLWTLEQGLGDAWSDEAKRAWTAAYTLVADVMRNAASDEPRLAN